MPGNNIASEVDDETKRALRIAAAKEDISMSKYIRRAVISQLVEDGELEGNATETPLTAD